MQRTPGVATSRSASKLRDRQPTPHRTVPAAVRVSTLTAPLPNTSTSPARTVTAAPSPIASPTSVGWSARARSHADRGNLPEVASKWGKTRTLRTKPNPSKEACACGGVAGGDTIAAWIIAPPDSPPTTPPRFSSAASSRCAAAPTYARA